MLKFPEVNIFAKIADGCMLEHRIKYKYNWKNYFLSFLFYTPAEEGQSFQFTVNPDGIDAGTDYKIEANSIPQLTVNLMILLRLIFYP